MQLWMEHVDRLRREDPAMRRGDWHAYRAAFRESGQPMRGEFILIRWRTPTVAVSHDDAGECVALARKVEEVFGPVPPRAR